jgi:hypothetical protein
MPLIRVLRGRVVKRTCRLGSCVLVTFRGPAKGSTGPRLLMPLVEYLAEVRTTYRPAMPHNDAPPH